MNISQGKDSKISLKLKGKVYWAHVHKKSEMSDKYQIKLFIDDKETLKRLKSEGISIGKSDKDTEIVGGYYVNIKSDIQPKVVDSKKNSLPDSVLIGNGSDVNVACNVYDWKFKNKGGKSLGLLAIQVVNLVPYEKKSGLAMLDIEDGYTAESTSGNLHDTKHVDGNQLYNVDVDDPDLNFDDI